MGLDKKMLEQLLSLPDAQLLQMIGLMSGGNISKLPDEKKMRQIRAVLSTITEEDLGRIAELSAVYKNAQ